MAVKYAIQGGGNWSGSTWNTADNQATSNTTAPVAGDTANITANCVAGVTVDVASACLVLDCTGFNSNLVMNNTVTVATGGTIKLPSGASGALTGTSNIISNGTLALTTNTKSIPALTWGTTGTKTITGDTTITGLMTVTGNTIINTGTITLAGGMTLNATLDGSSPLILTGGTWSGATAGLLCCSLSFAGNSTVSGMVYIYVSVHTCTLTYTSGTIDASTATLNFAISGITMNTGSNIRWGTISSPYVSNPTNVTLSSDLYCTNITSATNSYLTINSATYVVNCNGTIASTTTTFNGTADIMMTGTGAIDSTTNIWKCPIEINTAGTITIGRVLVQSAGIFKYTAGRVVSTGDTSGFQLSTGAKLDIGTIPTRINVSDITNGTGSATLLSNLVVGKITMLSLSSLITLTFTGAFDIDCTDVILTARTVLNVPTGRTISVSNSINTLPNALYNPVIQTTSGTANLNYQGTPANLETTGTTFTNLNASSSIMPIYTWFGTVTNCVNIYSVNGADIGGSGLTLLIN